MLQRGEVTVANVMPFITILRQLGTVALRGREGRRAGEREGDRERSVNFSTGIHLIYHY